MYNITKNFTWDENKRIRNLASRGIDFANAAVFDWHGAYIFEDLRRHYGEKRYVAIGYFNDSLTIMVYTPRAGSTRIISWRKANPREITRYGKEIKR